MKTLLSILFLITQAHAQLWVELAPNTKQPASARCQETWSHYCNFPESHLWDKTAKIPDGGYSFVNRWVKDGVIIKSDVSDTIPTKVVIGVGNLDDAIRMIVDGRMKEFVNDSLVLYKDSTILGDGSRKNPYRVNPTYVNAYFNAMSMTSTARNLLKPYEGQVIFNTSTKVFQRFTGGVWK